MGCSEVRLYTMNKIKGMLKDIHKREVFYCQIIIKQTWECISLSSLSLSVLLESRAKMAESPIYRIRDDSWYSEQTMKIGDYHLIWQSSQANFHLQYCANPNWRKLQVQCCNKIIHWIRIKSKQAKRDYPRGLRSFIKFWWRVALMYWSTSYICTMIASQWTK